MAHDHNNFDELELSVRPVFLKSVGRMLAVLWRPEMAKWRPRMGMALGLTLVSKLFAVGAPVLIGQGINALTASDPAAAVGLSFVTLFVFFALARLFANVLPQLRDIFFVRVTQDANRLVAVDAFAHAQAQSLQFQLTRRAGALNRIIERGSGAMEFLLRFLAFNIGPTIIELVLAAIVLAKIYGIGLSLAAIATVAIYAVLTIIITEWRNKLRRSMNKADTELRALAMDTFSNFETVKAFAAEKRETGRFNDALETFNGHYVRSMQSMYLLNGVQELVMTGGLLAAALIAGFGVVDGSMNIGDITAVILMLTNIYRPLNILGFAWREIKQGAVDIEKLFDLMDKKPDIEDRPNAKPFKRGPGAIRFEHISFLHEGRGAGLEDISFDVEGGSFLGIAGSSGAGKSTLLKLLFRFYEVDKGRILIDGQNLRDLTQSSLRENLGLVPQDVALFNDALRMNLAYAAPDASDEEIMAAAEKAQLGKFIKSLPDGLDTRVGERGLKLSGGERQRVGVARAILRDPPILILDEATSSLDSATEEQVQAALNEAARGRTTIAVAHRLSTIAHADKILVFDQGRIAEQGRHEELIAARGIYAELWRRQSSNTGDAPLVGNINRRSPA